LKAGDLSPIKGKDEDIVSFHGIERGDHFLPANNPF
jgi:hypothetical protein